MVAALQRFYGGDPARWLEIPFYIVRELADKMEAVEAMEMLKAAETAALGAGRLPREDRQKMLDGLQRKAAGGRRPRGQKLPASMLGGIGIGIEVVKPEKPDHE